MQIKFLESLLIRNGIKGKGGNGWLYLAGKCLRLCCEHELNSNPAPITYRLLNMQVTYLSLILVSSSIKKKNTIKHSLHIVNAQ